MRLSTKMTADKVQSVEAQAVTGSQQDSDLGAWLRLAAEMITVAETLAGVAHADRRSSPQITGLALLGRSTGHMRAVPLLIQAGCIVEARTITRSLFENMFLAVALSEKGAETVKELEADHHASRLKRGRLISRNTTSFSPEQIARIETHLQKLTKGRMLTPSEVAKRTSVHQAYLFYAQLSSDSAHPSFDALERHFVKDEGGGLVEVLLEPVPDVNELRDTLAWACMALLGILVAIQELTGATEASARITAVSDAYLRLNGELRD